LSLWCYIHNGIYLFNAIPDTNHNANPTNPNRNSKGNPNPTNPTNSTNPNTRYRCEYGTLNSTFAFLLTENKTETTKNIKKFKAKKTANS